MNVVWFFVIFSLEVLLVSGTCINPHLLEADDRKVCTDWWTEAVAGNDVRNHGGIERCIDKIVSRCPDVLTVVMTATKDKGGKKRVRVQVDATHTSLHTTSSYVSYRSRSLCYEAKGMRKDALCTFYQQVIDSVNWSENEKQKCKILMNNIECFSKK